MQATGELPTVDDERLRMRAIDVCQQKNRLQLRILTRINGDEAAFLRMIGRRKRVQVAVRETRCLEPDGHSLCGKRAASRRQTRVGLDQFLIKLTKALLAGGAILGRRAKG